MRSFTTEALGFLVHHDEHPTLWQPRHPITLCIHVPPAALLFLLYDRTMPLEQTFAFLVMAGLYFSSAAYHTWRPNRLLRQIDQLMISWFVVTTPLPWLYHKPWFIVLWLGLLATTAVTKWYQTESSGQEKITFFALGALSALLVLLFGLPEQGESLISWKALWVILTVALYIGKLTVYHYQWYLVRNYVEAPELGHLLCGAATSSYTLLIVGVVV